MKYAVLTVILAMRCSATVLGADYGFVYGWEPAFDGNVIYIDGADGRVSYDYFRIDRWSNAKINRYGEMVFAAMITDDLGFNYLLYTTGEFGYLHFTNMDFDRNVEVVSVDDDGLVTGNVIRDGDVDELWTWQLPDIRPHTALESGGTTVPQTTVPVPEPRTLSLLFFVLVLWALQGLRKTGILLLR